MKKIVLLISAIVFSFAIEREIIQAYYKSYNYEKMGDYKDAIKVLIPVYNKYPKVYSLNLRFGWLFYLNKQFINAIKYYQKASIVYPSSIEPKLGLMRVYNAIGDYNSVLSIGDSILKKDYYNFYGNYYEIIALKSKGDYRTALKIVNKMLYLYPTSILYLEQLGEIYWKIDKTKARVVFENLLILDPNNLVAKEYLKR
jgi:tetratricopeptide (TPR) repeat protein